MNIAIDASPLRGGHTNRGVGVYTRNLIDSLKTYCPQHSYHVFDSKIQQPGIADVIHYPYFDPFFLTLPVVSPKPTIVTVHDLIPILYPAHFPKGVRGSIKWEIQKFSLERKQRIITDSECSKEDIHKLTGFSKEKIDVVYLAPLSYRSLLPKKIDSVKKQFGIEKNYFLYVGDINWNKNIPGLLHAFSSFLKNQPGTRNSEPGILVLVGKAFLDTNLTETRVINKICHDLNIEDHLIRTGYVSDDQLAVLYHYALGLIQPSLYEGFGFPVLEAMSLGCPVICSNSSSLREIAGPSILIDPNNVGSIEDGMQKLARNSVEDRKQLVQRGYAWVKRFTWEKVAKETVMSYEKVLDHK